MTEYIVAFIMVTIMMMMMVLTVTAYSNVPGTFLSALHT